MKLRILLTALIVTSLSGHLMASDAIVVPRPVPFADSALIAAKIKAECVIQTQLADYIAEYAREKNITVTFADSTNADAEGQVLDIKITDAVSDGNPFIGHRKSTTVTGTLYRNGEVIGNFNARRNSMGGAFAGYKGSCSVLGRTVKVLGQDIAGWLAAPTKDAMLGDLG